MSAAEVFHFVGYRNEPLMFCTAKTCPVHDVAFVYTGREFGDIVCPVCRGFRKIRVDASNPVPSFSSVSRWTHSPSADALFPHPDGRWVRYEEHEKAVAELKEQLRLSRRAARKSEERFSALRLDVRKLSELGLE